MYIILITRHVRYINMLVYRSNNMKSIKLKKMVKGWQKLWQKNLTYK